MLERGFKNPEPGPPLLSSALDAQPFSLSRPRTLRVAHTSTRCGLGPASAATTTNLLSPLAWRQPPTTHLPSPPPCRTPAPHHPQGNLPHRTVTLGPSPRKSFSAVLLRVEGKTHLLHRIPSFPSEAPSHWAAQGYRSTTPFYRSVFSENTRGSHLPAFHIFSPPRKLFPSPSPTQQALRQHQIHLGNFSYNTERAEKLALKSPGFPFPIPACPTILLQLSKDHLHLDSKFLGARTVTAL